MKWLKDFNDDLYDPDYTDMLRVAFTTRFGRGRLQDLVALLSGRNFETRQYEEAIVEDSFAKLKDGIHAFINETHFKRFIMIIRSAGFITSNMITSHNAVNFAYILYLRGRSEGIAPDELERIVRRWYAMSILTGRYTTHPETVFDLDIRQIESHGIARYIEAVLSSELSESFWTTLLPQLMETSSVQSPYFIAFKAAQVCLATRDFFRPISRFGIFSSIMVITITSSRGSTSSSSG